ncbi:hypothetical protein ebA1435 [Aromatoleum aromaticum EbN1]|uniref:Uncharacterized protein n=1 Tax=Aromatoleum aromaticum (strain DSM 19018 / LMG 30748 / EbN1) TaxID=76114 RepID=Q5P703_AROAE|nr:hypothetical protein ebA1435 [Aromatoleum aromaticum EbN1]
MDADRQSSLSPLGVEFPSRRPRRRLRIPRAARARAGVPAARVSASPGRPKKRSVPHGGTARSARVL